MEAARNRNQFQRALASYARSHPGNGDIAGVQQRAVNHLARMDKRLWDAHVKTQCVMGKVQDINGKWHNACGKHGPKNRCRKLFEDWLKRQSY